MLIIFYALTTHATSYQPAGGWGNEVQATSRGGGAESYRRVQGSKLWRGRRLGGQGELQEGGAASYQQQCFILNQNFNVYLIF